ncbi:MAG: hypothetical protein LAN62_16610 [Acidobacteriia bacterium]|nr:hypothetical protein [Terriglobia bacterium]
MRRRLLSLILASLFALVVVAGLILARAESSTWDSSDDEAQEDLINLELAVSSLPTPRTLPQERVEIISGELAPNAAVRPASYFASSCGVPAEHGKDLLAFIEVCTT